MDLLFNKTVPLNVNRQNSRQLLIENSTGSLLELISRLLQLGNIQFVQLHVCMTLCHVFHLDLFSVTGSVFNDTQDCLVTRLVIQVCS